MNIIFNCFYTDEGFSISEILCLYKNDMDISCIVFKKKGKGQCIKDIWT